MRPKNSHATEPLVMKVRRVEIFEKGTIEHIVAIHNEMPRAWDPSHRIPREFLEKILNDIRSSTDPQGFWIFNPGGAVGASVIDGMIWAKIMKNPLNGNYVCKINSFWIRPELRNSGFAVLLTDPCLAWAREYGATQLECITHSMNSRMREILSKQGFTPGMVQYSLDL